MIITSTALIKSRLPNVEKIVNNLMSGDLIPDKIYFFVSENPHNMDEGIKPNELPTIYNDRVEFIYTENIGSLRKIVPIIKMYWTRPNTRIIVCDDDRKIQPDIIKNLVDYSQNINHRFHACATAGNIFKSGTKGREIVLGWRKDFKEPKQVDLLNSGMMMLVKPKFFPNDILHWEDYIDPFGVNLTDENFLSYLLAKKGIPRFVIPIKGCPLQLPVKEQLHCSKNIENYKALQASKFNKIMTAWKK